MLGVFYNKDGTARGNFCLLLFRGDFMKNYFRNAAYGVYVTAGIALLEMATAFVYVAMFGGTREFGALSFALMLAAAVLSLGLVGFRQYVFAPYALFAATVPASMTYIYSMYYYISVVLVGIDLQSFSAQFIFVTTLMALCLVGCVVAVFLPCERKNNSDFVDFANETSSEISEVEK